MARLRYFAVSIVVDGENLPEISDEDARDEEEDSPTQTHYIQVEEGLEFTVHITIYKSYPLKSADGLECRIIMDGEQRDSMIRDRLDIQYRSREFERDAAMFAVEDKWVARKFRFLRQDPGLCA